MSDSELTQALGELGWWVHLSDLVSTACNELIQERNLLDRARRARELQDREYALEQVANELTLVIRDAEATNQTVALLEALLHLSNNRRHAGHLEQSRALAEQASELAASIGDTERWARALLEIAKVIFEQGEDPTGCLGQLTSTRVLAPGVEYLRAKMAHRRGDLEAAGRCLEQALTLCCDEETPYLRCRILARLGFHKRLVGQLNRAKEYLGAALQMARQHGFRRVEACCLGDMGTISRLSQHPDAENQLRGALRLFAEVGDTLGTAHVCSALGALKRLQGSLDEAEMLNRAALAIYIERGYLSGEALARRRLAQGLRDGGRYEAAQVEFEKAIAIYKGLGHRDGQAVAKNGLAKLVLTTIGPKQALPLALEAVELLGEIGEKFSQESERADFSRLHSWCYSLAFLCAAESEDVKTALKIASIVAADVSGSKVRHQLAGMPGPVGQLVAKIIQAEHGVSKDEVMGPPIWTVESMAMLRAQLEDLFKELEGLSEKAATALRRAGHALAPLPPDAEEHRLTLYKYEHPRPPRIERGVVAIWEGPGEAHAVSKMQVSIETWERLQILAKRRNDALDDASRAERAILGTLLAPNQLREALLAHQVPTLRLLLLSESLGTLPLSSCLIVGQRLDSLTTLVIETPEENLRAVG